MINLKPIKKKVSNHHYRICLQESQNLNAESRKNFAILGQDKLKFIIPRRFLCDVKGVLPLSSTMALLTTNMAVDFLNVYLPDSWKHISDFTEAVKQLDVFVEHYKITYRDRAVKYWVAE